MSKKKNNRKARGPKAGPRPEAAQAPGSVNQILREYWSDVEEHEQLRVYKPGDHSAPPPPPAAEDAIRVYTAPGSYRERGDYSVRDILSQFWRDNPQAMVDMVRMPEPKAETEEQQEIFYTLREILSQFWKDNPQAMVDMVRLPEQPAAEKAEAAELGTEEVPAETETAEAEIPAQTAGAPIESLPFDGEKEEGGSGGAAFADSPDSRGSGAERASSDAAGAPDGAQRSGSVGEEEEGGSGFGAFTGSYETRESAEERASSDAVSLDEPESGLSFNLREILWEYWHKSVEAADAEEKAGEETAGEDEIGAGDEIEIETTDEDETGVPDGAQRSWSVGEEEEGGSIAPLSSPDGSRAVRASSDAAERASSDAAARAASDALPEDEIRVPEETGSGGYAYEEEKQYDVLDVLREYWTSGETSELEELLGHEPLRGAGDEIGAPDEDLLFGGEEEEGRSGGAAFADSDEDRGSEAERVSSDAEETASEDETGVPMEAQRSGKGESPQSGERSAPGGFHGVKEEGESGSGAFAAPYGNRGSEAERVSSDVADTEKSDRQPTSEEDILAMFNIAGIFGPDEAGDAPEETADEEASGDESPIEDESPAGDEEQAGDESPAGDEVELSAEADEVPEEREAPVERTSSDAAPYSVDDILAEFRMLFTEDHSGEEEGRGYYTPDGRWVPDRPVPKGETSAVFPPVADPGDTLRFDAVKPEEQEAPQPKPRAGAPADEAFDLTQVFSFTGGKEPEEDVKPEKKNDSGAAEAFGAGVAGAAAAATVAAVGGAAAVSGAAGSVSAAAREALAYMSSLTEEDYRRLKEEIEYDKPAPKPEEKPASSRRDDFGAFNLSGHQSGMVFNGRELDISPDEDYVPPSVPAEAEVYHWVRGEEELPDRAVEKPGLLQRILQWNAGGPKKPKKRPLNAPAARPEAVSAPAAEEIAAAAAEAPDSAAAVSRTPDEELSFAFDDTADSGYAPDRDYAGEASEEDLEAQFGGEIEKTEIPETSTAEQDTDISDTARAAAPAGKKDPVPEAEDDLEVSDEFPSFTQFLGAQLTALLVRLRGFGGRGDQAATMVTDEEELGPELTPMAASKYYGAHVHSLRLRFTIALALLAVMAWISLGLPVTGAFKSIRVAAGFCLAAQLTVMLLCLDVVANSAVNLLRGRFGADSLAVTLCVLTCFDALAVALDGFGNPHMPLCLFSSLALCGVLLSSMLSARSLRKSLRVPAIGVHRSAVTAEDGLKGRGLTLLKTERNIEGFVHRSEEAPPDETAWYRAAPLFLALALLMSLLVSLVKHSGSDFLYILTALLTPAIPAAALLAFAGPFFVGSMRIFSSGAAIAGWSGVTDIGKSQDLVVTDRDLFPEGSVEIDSIRIFADVDPVRIISYTGTMIAASGAGLSACFAELMEHNGGSIRRAENFEILPGGGFQANIDGSTVLCGSTDLMRLMNVRVPFRLVGKTSVLLAVDGVLYGIFNMKYQGLPQVRKALVGLMRSNRHPIFAVRDFNVNPEMLRGIFDLATDGYDFPPYVERFTLSAARPGGDKPVAAVVCREGLGPLTNMADTGRSVYVMTRVNLLVTLLGAALGLLLVFFKLLGAGSVSLWFLLIFLLAVALPVAVTSLFLKF